MQDHDKDLDNDFDDADFMDVDDDLGDDLDYLDDVDDMDSDDWDEDGFDDGSEDKPKKKKSLGTNATVIIAAVVIGAAVMLWQLAKPEPDQLPKEAPFQSALSPQGQVNNPVTAPARQAQQERQERENESQEGGFLKNLSEIDEIESTEPVIAIDDTTDLMGDIAPPMPAPISSTIDGLSDASLTPMPDLKNEADGIESVAQDLEVLNELPAPRPPQVNDSAAVQNETMGAAELLESKIAERQEGMENELSSASAGIDVFEPSLETGAEQNMLDDNNAAAEMEENFSISDSLPAPVVNEVSSDLQSLQKELEATKIELQQVRDSKSEEILSLSSEVASLKEQLSSKSAATVKKEAPVVKKAQTTRKTKPKTVSKKSWELRAAMPGKAWVSEKGKKEMRSVVVGDSLSGIGRVTAITYSNGLWVVDATQGRIQQ